MNWRGELDRLMPHGIGAYLVSGLTFGVSMVVLHKFRPDAGQIIGEIWNWLSILVASSIMLLLRLVWVWSGRDSTVPDGTRRSMLLAVPVAFASVGYWLGAGKRVELDAPEELESRYVRRKTLRLCDLVSDRAPVLEDRYFDECKIYGPAVIMSAGITTITQCEIFTAGTSPADAFWVTDRHLVGGIVVRNCTFKRCELYYLGFAGSRRDLERFMRDNPSAP